MKQQIKLVVEVDGAFFPPDPLTPPAGPPISQRVALNPPFVEALMGLPVGWTDCLSSATESYHSWLRQHSFALSNVLDWYDDFDG